MYNKHKRSLKSFLNKFKNFDEANNIFLVINNSKYAICQMMIIETKIGWDIKNHTINKFNLNESHDIQAKQ